MTWIERYAEYSMILQMIGLGIGAFIIVGCILALIVSKIYDWSKRR